MSELDLITTRNIVKGTKRSKTEYFDVTMAILNSIIIISILTLVRNSTIISNIFGLLFIGILFIGGIITFLKRNPCYIYFFYGFTFCGILGNVFLITGNPFLMLIFIPQSLYAYSKIADLFMDPSEYIFSGKTQKQILEEKRRRELVETKRRELEKKFESNLIALISLGCSIGLFIILIFSA